MKRVRILALIAAVVAGIAIFIFLRSLNKPVEIPKSNVVVAAMDIPENTAIAEEMVKVISLPNEAVLANAVDDASLVVGKVFTSDMYTGEQIISDRLVEVGEYSGGTLAYTINPGMRAITISVSETTGLIGMIKPEDNVDIIAQFDSETKTANPDGSTETKTESKAKILIQNIKVLAVDKAMNKEGKKDGENYTTITLEVTPDQALKVSFSENSGMLRAILRSPLDEGVAAVPSVMLDDVAAD